MNIADIARLANVSPATVSRVLNGTARVNEDTKQRVLEVIKDNNFTRNIAAISLSTKNKLNNIGIVIPDIDNFFFSALLKRITHEADKYQYNVLLFNTDEDPDREHRFLQTVIEQNLKGLIIVPLSEEDPVTLEYLLRIEDSGVPVVLVDRKVGEDEFCGVFTNDESDAYRAVEILIKGGHRRIATIAGSLRSASGKNRLRGYVNAMEDHYGELNDKYIEYGDFKFRESYEAVNRLLDLELPPTAIFTSNNYATLAALRGITERGMEVGKDISLFGFDEIESWLNYFPYHNNGSEFSFVERPVDEMARQAMKLLRYEVENGTESNRKRQTVLLSNKMMIRE